MTNINLIILICWIIIGFSVGLGSVFNDYFKNKQLRKQDKREESWRVITDDPDYQNGFEELNKEFPGSINRRIN